MDVKLNKYYDYLKINSIKTFSYIKGNGDFDLLIKYDYNTYFIL